MFCTRVAWVCLVCLLLCKEDGSSPVSAITERRDMGLYEVPLSVLGFGIGTEQSSRRYVCCSECVVVSNECNEPTSCLVQPIGAHGYEVMYFWCLGFRGELGFLNYDDVCMCVVNKQFELLKFVSESVYVDLQYDEISLTFTAGPVWC